jgi:hypothetical protein
VAQAADLFCITKELLRFEDRDVQTLRIAIPNPKPWSLNKEAVYEDYFVFQENGQVVLVEVSSRSPLAYRRVDPKTPEGAETWEHVSRLGADVATLLKRIQRERTEVRRRERQKP